MATKLSGVVITKNEADRIERCLRSLLLVCSEVIVLDSGSTDDTVQRARELGAQVLHQDWLGFSAQKNAAIARASHPWVLLLDADEWLDEQACQHIRALTSSAQIEDADVWRLHRRTHFLGKALNFGGRGKEAIDRLFRRDLRYLPAQVHEELDLSGRRIAALNACIEHDTARSEDEYRKKLNRYAQLFSEQKHTAGKHANRASALLHSAFYWLKYYLLRGGFLDGALGFRYHRCHADYVRDKYTLLFALERNHSIAAK